MIFNICFICLNIGITHVNTERDSTGINKSTQLDEQLAMNSEGSLIQKSSDLVNEVTNEDTELLGQRPRSFQVVGYNPEDETLEKCK